MFRSIRHVYLEADRPDPVPTHKSDTLISDG